MIGKGWNSKLAEQLVHKSTDKTIREFATNDALHRFFDETAAKAWFKQKQPTFYSLTRTAELSGMIWYSQNQRSDLNADYTFEIWMYDKCTRLTFANDFMEFCEKNFRRDIQPKRI